MDVGTFKIGNAWETSDAYTVYIAIILCNAGCSFTTLCRCLWMNLYIMTICLWVCPETEGLTAIDGPKQVGKNERIGFKQCFFWLTLFCNNPIFWVTSFFGFNQWWSQLTPLRKLVAPEESLPKFMEFFTRKLQATGAFFCGDKPTIADLQILAQLRYFTKGVADHVPADSWRWIDDVVSSIPNDTRNGKSTGNMLYS